MAAAMEVNIDSTDEGQTPSATSVQLPAVAGLLLGDDGDDDDKAGTTSSQEESEDEDARREDFLAGRKLSPAERAVRGRPKTRRLTSPRNEWDMGKTDAAIKVALDSVNDHRAQSNKAVRISLFTFFFG
jgi:hypothetical protein